MGLIESLGWAECNNQVSWLENESSKKEESTKKKQAKAEPKAMRQKGASKGKYLQEKKSMVVTEAKQGKVGLATKKT